MKRHTAIFFIVITLFVIYAIAATYKRSFAERDFILVTEDEEEIDASTGEIIEAQ